MDLPRSFEEFEQQATQARRAAEWLAHLYPSDRRLASIRDQLGHLGAWTAAGLQPCRSQRALFNFHSIATSALDRSDFELAMSCSLLVRALETWGLDLPSESLRVVQRVAGAPDADELRAVCDDEAIIEPAVWRLAARYGSAFDLRLVDEVLQRDPIAAPHLLENPSVPDGTMRAVIAWATMHLALRPSPSETRLHAHLVLRSVAPMLQPTDPSLFALFAALMNATMPGDTWHRRLLFDVLVRVRRLEPQWLAEMVPVVRRDGADTLRAVVWHPAATTEFWRAVFAASSDPELARTVVPMIASRRKSGVEQVILEFGGPRPTLDAVGAPERIACPRCRMTMARPYLYGDLTAAERELCRRGDAKMGGVRIAASAPEWFCSICEHSWNVAVARRDEVRGLWAIDPARDGQQAGASV
jgi:hypothetical protein